ncbi:MAG: DNA helicase II, partial [Dokdonella sp.]
RPRVQVSRPAFAGRFHDPSPATAAPFKLGQRVQHASFGEGVVLAYEGAGAHTLVEINFADAGRKRLVLAYANLSSL